MEMQFYVVAKTAIQWDGHNTRGSTRLGSFQFCYELSFINEPVHWLERASIYQQNKAYTCIG